MISALKGGTHTSQIFWGCDDTNTGGRLGVFVDGVLYEGDQLVAANDYTGTVTAYGLRPETEHEFQMAIDGVAMGPSYKFKTLPSPNNRDFDILVFGDAFDPEPVINLITQREKKARLMIGTELSYIEQVRPGQPADNPRDLTSANPTGYQNYLDWYRGWYRYIWKFPNWQKLVNTIPCRCVWHNHELSSDTTGNVPTVGEIQFDAAIKAFREYEGAGQPSASDTGIPVDSWPDPVVYFGENVGPLSIVMTDITSYSWGALDYQMTNPTRGDQRQIEWTKAWLNTNTRDFVILYHPTNIATGSASNGGNAYLEWMGTTGANNTDGLLYFLAEFMKPVVCFSANTHTAHARGVYHSAVPTSWPLPELNISPIKQTSRASHGFLPTDNTIGLWKNFWWKNTHNTERDPALNPWPNPIDDLYKTKGWDMEWYYGLIEVRGDEMFCKIKEVITGRVVFSMSVMVDKAQKFQRV